MVFLDEISCSLLPYDYLLVFLNDICFILLSFFKKQKNLVVQAEYNEEAYLDLLLYFVLFENEAAILTL